MVGAYTGFLEGGSTKVYSLKQSAGSETTAQCAKHTLQNADHEISKGSGLPGNVLEF